MTTLLPPSRTPAAIDDVLRQYPDSVCVSDVRLSPAPPRLHALPERLPRVAGEMPRVAAGAVALVAFTSGSTGTPKANPKTWAALRISTAQNAGALRHLWPARGVLPLVATVPPQHMYGMELSVLLPLLTSASVHGGRPFFPDDVARAVATAVDPPLLVTTPVHLRALVESGIALPPLAGIVTATAPLPQSLAAAAEQPLVFMKVPGPSGDAADYSIDHSAALVLLDPQARMAGVAQPPFDVKGIAADLETLTAQAATPASAK